MDHDEPRLQGPRRAAREPEGPVPPLRHVRAGPDEHLRDHAQRRGVPGGPRPGQEVRDAVPPQQAAALRLRALRLGAAGGQVRAGGRRGAEAWRPDHRRAAHADAGPAGHQHGQAVQGRHLRVHEAHRGPVPQPRGGSQGVARPGEGLQGRRDRRDAAARGERHLHHQVRAVQGAAGRAALRVHHGAGRRGQVQRVEDPRRRLHHPWGQVHDGDHQPQGHHLQRAVRLHPRDHP
mmetsp:Transcript_120631/g.210028  ORF Transcript_120631/g.210028 Transcript_120631/m.210028 type:complete len:234 (-) Transcript_120631:5597-6298(-)